MIRIEDYSDEELTEEIKERGYAVYNGKEMQFCITQLERMQSKITQLERMQSKIYGGLESNKKGDKHGK